MAKLSLTTITSRYASVDALNANFEAIEEALENTLSRDGTAPNVLEADIDVNGNRILNLPTPSTSGEPINLGWAVANYPDFQTVAGLATEIEALGDIVTEIIEVYNKRSSIITVGNNIGAVINVGDNISNVVTTSAYINPIITVSNNVSSIQTVKNNINSVNTVAGAISNVNTVAGSIASVNTVSGISSDVTAVALINGDVTTVSGISADVTTVAADGTDIGTVATNIADVNTVAGISGNVTTVAGDTANIGTVAGNIVDVNTVANISADVSDVAGISTNVTTVAGIQSDVSAVAANNVNVSTVAANIVDVNAFADTYFISATAPGAPTAGDLWYDTSASSIRVYNGSTWTTVDAVDATSVNAAGAVMNTDTTTAAMSFVVDEDTFASNSDTKVPTQQSVKAYVDNATAAALHYHDPVRLESPVALSADYDNGTDGVGATLTNNSTQEALVIDGVAAVVNDRVLIYQQTNAAHNGVYTVTDIGSVSTNWVLTRATDADSYSPSDPDSFGTGDSFYVQEGNTGAGESYVLTTQGTITFGTTNLTFSQFSATPQYTGVDNIDITGFNVSFTTAGTPTAGQALVWDSGTSQWEPGDVTFEPYDAAGNTFVGDSALSSLTTGNNNTAVGKDALNGNRTGNSGVALGFEAAYSWDAHGTFGITAVGYQAAKNSTAGTSTGVGYQALFNNTGSRNTAVGHQSLYYPTSGSDNTAMGYRASLGSGTATGYSNTSIGSYANNAISSGIRNTAVGHSASIYNTTGSYNTSVGWNADSNSNSNVNSGNTFVGAGSGDSNQTGDENTCLGKYSGIYYTNASNTVSVGYHCKGSYGGGIAIGSYAGYYQSGQYYNVAIGYNSARNGSGQNSVFVGYQAGLNANGNNNTAVGMYSLDALTNASFNTAIGSQSLTLLTSGSYNCAIGHDSARAITTGNYNTSLGTFAAYTSTTGSYNTTIGYSSTTSSTTANYQFTLGNANITNLRCNDTSISSLSDERDKTNIQDITWGLDFINDVRPVSFQWNRRDGTMGDTKQVGFIAQELYDVELEHSSTQHTKMVLWDNPDRLEAAPMRMFPILVKAVQELSAQVETLKAEIATLKGE